MNGAWNGVFRSGRMMWTAFSMKWPRVVLWFAVPLLAQEPPNFRTDVNLVRVPLTVTQANGALVQDLRREEFVVLEDGVRQEVRHLWRERDLPLTFVLVGDISCSRPNTLIQRQKSVQQFLDRVLSRNDRAALVSVSEQARLVTDMTDSRQKLQEGAKRLLLSRDEDGILGDACSGKHPSYMSSATSQDIPCGRKALWNAVYFGATLKLRPQAGRKAMLLLTDGLDTGSDYEAKQAIAACEGADAIVYSIRSDDPGEAAIESKFEEYARWAGRRRSELRRIARDTGGLEFDASKDELPTIFKRIEADLRSQYVLGYTPSAERGRRSYHKLKVKVTRPGVTVRAREGYYSE